MGLMMARPSKYSDELVTEICRRIADGESLRSICREEGMPNRDTIREWLRDKPEFSVQYARAREEQADGLFDKALDILTKDHTDNVEVQSDKLNFDIIKWTAGKLAPKKYGEYKQVDANVTSVKRPDQMTEEELQIFLNDSGNS